MVSVKPGTASRISWRSATVSDLRVWSRPSRKMSTSESFSAAAISACLQELSDIFGNIAAIGWFCNRGERLVHHLISNGAAAQLSQRKGIIVQEFGVRLQAQR